MSKKKKKPLAYEIQTKLGIEAFRLSLLDESDRGLVLVGAAFIEEQLEALLRAHFLFEESLQNSTSEETGKFGKIVNKLFGYGPLGSFYAKADMAYSLGLIPEWEHWRIDLLRDVRNSFAHNIESSSFESQDVVKLLERFVSPENVRRDSIEKMVIQLAALIFTRVSFMSNSGLSPDAKRSYLAALRSEDVYNLKQRAQ